MKFGVGFLVLALWRNSFFLSLFFSQSFGAVRETTLPCAPDNYLKTIKLSTCGA
jgi:hypothetical protein